MNDINDEKNDMGKLAPNELNDTLNSPNIDEKNDIFDDEEDEEIEHFDPNLHITNLYEYCKTNKSELALELIQKNVPIHHTEDGWTCLHWAAYNGDEKLVQELIHRGTSSRYRNARTSFHLTEDDRKYRQQQDELLLKNTPLHWAAYGGHLRICWLLLEDGYSPEDSDEVGNTSLHLASSNNHKNIVRCLLNDGANPYAENKFRNIPLDLTSSSEIQDMLQEAMDSPPPSTFERDQMHGRNINLYHQVHNKFEETLDKYEDNEVIFKADQESIDSLNQLLEQGDLIGVENNLLDLCNEIIDKINLCKKIRKNLKILEENSPIIVQKLYTDCVNPLDLLSKKARLNGLDGSLLQSVDISLNKAHSEYWLQVAINLLQNVKCADEVDVRNIERLKKAINKADNSFANGELINKATLRYNQLVAELELRRSVRSIPEVRIPPEEKKEEMEEKKETKADRKRNLGNNRNRGRNDEKKEKKKKKKKKKKEDPLKDFWKEEDIGYLEENDGFPLPPSDGYKWISSLSLRTLRSAVKQLESALDDVDNKPISEDLIAEAKEIYEKSSQDLKKLESKDDDDRNMNIKIAEKAAKKLRRKKKGKKKKKKF